MWRKSEPFRLPPPLPPATTPLPTPSHDSVRRPRSFREHSKFYARRSNMSLPSVLSATRACTATAVLLTLLLTLATNRAGAAAVDTTVVADATVTTVTTTAVTAATVDNTLDTVDIADTADNVLQPSGYGLPPSKPSLPPPVRMQHNTNISHDIFLNLRSHNILGLGHTLFFIFFLSFWRISITPIPFSKLTRHFYRWQRSVVVSDEHWRSVDSSVSVVKSNILR